jgi:hypothetical protein
MKTTTRRVPFRIEHRCPSLVKQAESIRATAGRRRARPATFADCRAERRGAAPETGAQRTALLRQMRRVRAQVEGRLRSLRESPPGLAAGVIDSEEVGVESAVRDMDVGPSENARRPPGLDEDARLTALERELGCPGRRKSPRTRSAVDLPARALPRTERV